MVVLGIDPGYATIGYGAIDYNNNRGSLLTYGTITTPAGKAFELRLLEIYRDLHTLLDKVRPDTVCVEELFFNTNTTTAIQVAQARGVVLLVCAEKGYRAYEYTPLQVKQAVVGYGRAEKKQVQEMTRVFLNMDKIPKPDDAADALAIAICHAHTMGSLITRGTER